MPQNAIGIGPALKRAREHRAKSVDEAARDTKIRSDFLFALEREDFDALHGDVYVRGFLRSYSQYLGLDANKVLAAYVEGTGVDEAPPPPMPSIDPDEPEERALKPRHTSSWILAGGIALLALFLMAAFGLLSNSGSTPEAAVLPSALPTVDRARPVVVKLLARREVDATITVDDAVDFQGVLHAGEARTFTGETSVAVSFGKGGVVSVAANGEKFGLPGTVEAPYSETFLPPKEASSQAP